MKQLLCALLLLLGTPAAAHAADRQVVLRLATSAPQGTVWAREMSAFGREVSDLTFDAVKVKIYFGAIAGDEVEVGSRIDRGQLDGAISGGAMCQNVSPTMRVARLPGLYRSWDEVSFVLKTLQPRIAAEARQAGYVDLGSVVVGVVTLFSRKPITTVSQLRLTPLWVWSLDHVGASVEHAIGFNVLSTTLEDAGPSYDNHQLDGFLAIPAAALAFQWTSRARYVSNIEVGYLAGCVLIANRSFDRLTLDEQKALQAATAKLYARLDDAGKLQDQALLGVGLLKKQGLKRVPLSSEARVAWAQATKVAREHLVGTLVPSELMEAVDKALTEYRTRH